jgi:hypothetical protein
MNEAGCNAYVNEGTIPMETFLYGWEYLDYNEDHQLDAFVYCCVFRCQEGYCQGIGL